ncbi:hypothetical protein BC834DRAFT_886447 [Gloeopeniophorella convolvens]|nr:hypothetical protein BC834DRAFT_886447 [Gloeopeniophorella convolvens]
MRGTLSSPRGTFDVVAKLGYGADAVKALSKETGFYQKLSHLQGVCIPKCFGFFLSPSETLPFGCLLLEYSGKPIRSTYDSLDDIPYALRTEILDSMKRIHDTGVVHGGFRTFDVLVTKAKPFIINFKRASEKACERRADIVYGAIVPSREQFGCPELYRLCLDLRIWKPRTLTLKGQKFSVEDVSNPAALAAKTSDGTPPTEKAQVDALHATVIHLLDFYREEFPGLEERHEDWLNAGSPPPNAHSANGGDVAGDLWSLQIPIRSQMPVRASL